MRLLRTGAIRRLVRGREVFGIVLPALRERRRALIHLAAWSTAGALPALVCGRLVARAVDQGFLSSRPVVGLAWLAALGVAMVVGAWATRQVYRCLAEVAEAVRDELVTRVVGGALHNSARWAGRPDTAAVARLTHQIEIVREALAGMLRVVLGFAFNGTAALAGLLALSPVLLLFVLPPLAAALGLGIALLIGVARGQRRLVLANEAVAEHLATIADGLRDVVACGGEDRVYGSASVHIERAAAAERTLARLAAARALTLALGGWLPLVLLLAAAPWLVRHGASTGTILGAITYLFYGLHPVLQELIQRIGGNGTRLFVGLERIAQAGLLPATADPAPARPAAAPSGHELELRAVTFRYRATAEPIVRDLDLTIAENDHVAIVGPSGVGKSTLAGLMAGMLTPQQGQVRLGGAGLHELDPHQVTGHRVLVPQQPYVFAGTFEENLTYLCPGASPIMVKEAVEVIGLQTLVDRLGGLQAGLRASALSAGEKQLVALGRAYLAPAGICVLDEAASHLDRATETRAEQAFARRPGTLIVIAHRVSSALRARRVIVMDEGKVSVGTHDCLMRESGLYRELVGHWQTAGSRTSQHSQ